MGIQNSLIEQEQQKKKPSKGVQNIYEMYKESLTASKLHRISSLGLSQKQMEKQRKLKKKLSQQQMNKSKKIVDQLLQSFQGRQKYDWGQSISFLFKKHFLKQFLTEWKISKQNFYELLLHNCGLKPQQKSIINLNDNEIQFDKIGFTLKQQTYQDYFYQICNNNKKISIRSSIADNQMIDWHKQEEIKNENPVDVLNYSIIRSNIEFEEDQQSKNVQQNKKSNQDLEDDQYFLPLICNRKKKKKKQDKFISQICDYQDVQVIQMSEFNKSKSEYSRERIQAASIIVPDAIFYDRMNFEAKVQTDQLLKFYRQFSNTIQQSIFSCNLISCPIKHFQLHMEMKTHKKKIQTKRSHTQTTVEEQKMHSSLTQKKIHDDNNLKKTQILVKKSLLLQDSEQGELLRQKRLFNTNLLLTELKDFSQSYTEFIYKYLDLHLLQGTQLAKFLNIDTVYGIILKNLWNLNSWVGQRGYQWEQYKLPIVLLQDKKQLFDGLSDESIQKKPTLLLAKYCQFINKNLSKVKITQRKILTAYHALLKLQKQKNPQKYLKKIVIFYRQSTQCCQGADDLVNVYQFLLKIVVKNENYKQMHFFRMKNIIEKLININEFYMQGGGQITYAWTTWNIMMEMFLQMLSQYKINLQAKKTKKKEQKQNKQKSYQQRISQTELKPKRNQGKATKKQNPQ